MLQDALYIAHSLLDYWLHVWVRNPMVFCNLPGASHGASNHSMYQIKIKRTEGDHYVQTPGHHGKLGGGGGKPNFPTDLY